MSGKCGCAGTTCSCKVTGEGGISVRGAGSAANPYVISGGANLQGVDTETADTNVYGDGSAGDPYRVSVDVTMDLDELENVDTSTTATGYVLARQGDGTFGMNPPVTAEPGLINTDDSLEGDGSSPDPLAVRLGPQSSLAVDVDGLAFAPRTVTDEADLDTEHGSAPLGSIVTMEDGSAAWAKTLTGWVAILEDIGPVTTVGSNIVNATGWEVQSIVLRRRNGLVQFRLVIKNLVARNTGIDSGNIDNVQMATLVPAEFRPTMDSALRVTSAGADHAVYITTAGTIWLSNLAQPDVTYAAGEVLTFAGTYIGA